MAFLLVEIDCVLVLIALLLAEVFAFTTSSLVSTSLMFMSGWPIVAH